MTQEVIYEQEDQIVEMPDIIMDIEPFFKQFKSDELEAMANGFKNLKIDGVDDKDGYEAVKLARRTLQKERTRLSKFRLALTKGATKFQKDAIAKENELISIIEPVEKSLLGEIERVDLEKEMARREEDFPNKLRMLNLVNPEGGWDKEFILTLDNVAWLKYYADVRQAEQDKKDAEIARKMKEIEDEKARLAEEERQRQERELAATRARLDEQRKAQEAIEQAKLDAEADKKRALDEKQAEIDRLERERDEIETQRANQIAEGIRKQKEKEDKEKRDTEALIKKQEYLKFLSDCGYSAETKDDFTSIKTETTITLYKKVGTFNIN